MFKLILDHAEFKRSILHLDGSIEGLDSLEGVDFFLQDRGTKREIPITEVKTNGNHFSIRINSMQLDDEYPIQDGKWYPMAKLTDGTVLKPYVTDAVYDRIFLSESDGTNIDLMVDRGLDNYWYGFSKLNKKDWTYYLDVNFSVPEKDTTFFLVKFVKKRIRAFKKFVSKNGFTAFYSLCRHLVKKKGNKVFFTSDRTDKISGNEKFVYDRMVERGLDKKYQIVFDFKDGIKTRRTISQKFKFTYHLATSDYIFLDDFQPEVYKCEFDPEVKIIQLWHACGAFKTVGFERIGKKGSPGFMTRLHKCYTHVTVSSEHSAEHNAEAFAIDRRKFFPTGIARTDAFFDPNFLQASRDKALAAFPQLSSGKKVLLYAPTFRGTGAKNANFPIQVISFHRLGDFLREINAVMLIKLHPFVTAPIEIPDAYKDCFIDAYSYPDINELLTVSDVVITDYSSVIYEAGLLKKPMLFYAFDLNNYDGDRGFYEPFEEIVPGKIVTTLQQLMDALAAEDYEQEKLEGFLKKNFTYLDGHSTDRIIDLIFGNEDGGSLA